MTKTFATLKTEAAAASSLVDLYRVVNEANGKLIRNINKAKLMSYTHGMAAEADYYFGQVIPGWQAIVNEINAIWTRAASGKPASEIVVIIEEAGA